MQNLTSASVSQAGARLWTIEYQDFRQSNYSFSSSLYPFQTIPDTTGAIVPASCGLLIRGLKSKQGGAINKEQLLKGGEKPCLQRERERLIGVNNPSFDTG